jgi:hypothetical protein
MSATASGTTHVVADALNNFTFDYLAPFAPVTTELNRIFGIAPTDLHDLVNIFSRQRPDLLIGMIDPAKSQLRIIAGATGLDPCSSTVIRHALERLCLAECWRCLVVADNKLDTWVTPYTEMFGGVPPVLFHGTSNVYLASIRAAGLITTGLRNWLASGRNEVYLTASPQIAAFHARRTAEATGAQPIVVACRRPNFLVPDWDVVNLMVNNAQVPSNDGRMLAREAGLFASPAAIPVSEIVDIREAALSTPYMTWRCV